ncbi:MAG TPA: hypothetical protein VHJ19_03865 [Gammaproteobacteria bacterium]|nr:hypothetical protein [Gammaproteobacteria bacterium]
MPAKLTNPSYRPGSLSTTCEIRRELSRVYRDMRQGMLNTSDRTKLAYVLAVMARLVEQTEDESRIEGLEEIARERASEPQSAH